MDELEEIFVAYPALADALRQGLIKSVDGTKKDRMEHGGLIGKNPDGTFYLMENGPVGGGPEGIDIRQRTRRKGDELAGIYHSHPGKDDLAELFSETDVNSAGAVGVPSAIVEADRDLEGHEFVSGRDRVRRGGVARGAHSEGSPFMGGRRMEREYLTEREKTASLEELAQDALVAELRKSNPVMGRN